VVLTVGMQAVVGRVWRAVVVVVEGLAMQAVVGPVWKVVVAVEAR